MNSLVLKIVNISLLGSCLSAVASHTFYQPLAAVAYDRTVQEQVLPSRSFIVADSWAATDFAPGKLDVHFNKHVAEWGVGNITKEAYKKRAISLLNSPIGGNILGFTDKDGYRFRYNSKTNEFATGKPDGTIETLFRPSTGMKYYQEQVTKYG